MHSQRVDVADTPLIEITRTCVMARVASSPVIVRGQGHDADGSADPIVCGATVEERPVAAVVLDHEEADEEARRRYYQQQSNPIAMVQCRPDQRPNDKEGH